MKRSFAVAGLLLSVLLGLGFGSLANPAQADLTAPVSPTSTSFYSPLPTPLPEDYERQRAEAADYWLRHVHKLPVPPRLATTTPQPAMTSEPPNTMVGLPRSNIASLVSESSQTTSHRVYLPVVTKSPVEVHVFVIAYMDILMGRAEFPQLLEDIRTDLGESTRWHGTGSQSLYFTISQLITTTNTSPINTSGNLSFKAIFDTYDLCTKIDNGEIDQVWLFNPGTVPNPVEFAVNGDSYGIWNHLVDMPKCHRPRPMFTFVYANFWTDANQQLQWFPAYPHQAVHSFSHYVETLFWYRKQEDRLYCDFIAANGRVASYQESGDRSYFEFPPECSSAFERSDQYALTSLALSSRSIPQAVCGDVHFPPNITVATEPNEYQYNRSTAVQSICNTWRWGQNPAAASTSCTTWEGCTDGTAVNCPVGDTICAERRYLLWWLQHVPGVGNDSIDRQMQVRSSWWQYSFP